MDFCIQLILTDNITNHKWITPNHDDNKQNDDFHRAIKSRILKGISLKIKKRYGRNCDIEISDNQIVLVSQIINETSGKRLKERIYTNLNPEDFFQKIPKLTFNTISKELFLSNVNQFEIKFVLDRTKSLVLIFLEF